MIGLIVMLLFVLCLIATVCIFCVSSVRDKENLMVITELHSKAVRERADAEQALADARRDLFPFGTVEQPEWSTDLDVEVNRFFKHTEAGSKLMTALEYLEQYQNRRAVLSHQNTPYMSGYAAGWHGCVAYLKSLSSKSTLQDGQPPDKAAPQPGQKQETDAGAFDPAEHYAP
jgi:hypothetical protein